MPVATTSEVQDSYAATWNQVICPSARASDLMASSFGIEVLDSDVGGNDTAGTTAPIFDFELIPGALEKGLRYMGAATGGTVDLYLTAK